MEKSKLTKAFVLVSGLAFLASSTMGLSGLIGSSLNAPTEQENTSQSQSAQFAAEEKGFLTVLKREPDNQTALRGLVQIRLQRNDAPGTREALEKLVKLNPTNKEYKEFLAALDKQLAESKKVGTLKATQSPQQKKLDVK
jgi:predicted Zn-dependent protease